MYRTGQRFGVGHVADVLRGHSTDKVGQWDHDQLSVFGIGEEMSRDEWMAVFRQLVHLGYLRQDIAEYSALKLTEASRGVLRGEVPVQLAKVKAKPLKAAKAKKSPIALEGLEVDEELFERLRELRREIAAEQKVPAYVVFADRSLADMAARRPATEEEFLACHGVRGGEAGVVRGGVPGGDGAGQRGRRDLERVSVLDASLPDGA